MARAGEGLGAPKETNLDEFWQGVVGSFLIFSLFAGPFFVDMT